MENSQIILTVNSHKLEKQLSGLGADFDQWECFTVSKLYVETNF